MTRQKLIDIEICILSYQESTVNDRITDEELTKM